MGNTPNDIYEPSVGDKLKIVYGCNHGAASTSSKEWSTGTVVEIINKYNRGFCGFKMKVEDSSHITFNSENPELKVESMNPKSELDVKLFNEKWHRLNLISGNIKIEEILHKVYE